VHADDGLSVAVAVAAAVGVSSDRRLHDRQLLVPQHVVKNLPSLSRVDDPDTRTGFSCSDVIADVQEL
jgi:hypothetical protein